MFSFSAIIFRFYQIQIVDVVKTLQSESFLKLSKHASLRGEIYDRQDNPLVLNQQTFNVYANTEAILRQPKLRKQLQRELEIKSATFSALLKLGQWRKIKNNISVDKRSQLAKFYPKYLNFEEDWQRYYPEGSSSAYLLGFLGKNDLGQPQGYVGVEGYLDQELEGLPVINENEADFLGIPFIGGIISNRKDRSGLDLSLTVDKQVQQIVETELKQGLKRYQAKSACAIIMEPYQGEILALSCWPGFDPHEFYRFQSGDFVNPAVAEVYEPGSTFKPLIVAIGLETNSFKPNTVVPESGPYSVGPYQIATWDNQYRGKINVTQTLAKSSNVGMVELINRIPQVKTESFFHKLGLYDLTGIELEGEAKSLLKDRRDWHEIDYLTYSFGQGLAITPIQLVRAFATLANDGYLVQPSVVRAFYDPNTQERIPKKTTAPVRVFSESTVKALKKMLFTAVNSAEAIWPNRPKNYAICGKTGTAQIAVGGSYDPSHTVASFIGFVPCDQPKFLALVLYQQPRSSVWGSETAAPSFFEIANQLILYYNIAP